MSTSSARPRNWAGPIAHGYLVLSLIPFLAKNIVTYTGVGRGINYGSNKVRFTNTVPVGARLRMRMKMLSCEAARRRLPGDQPVHHRSRGRRAPGLRG